MSGASPVTVFGLLTTPPGQVVYHLYGRTAKEPGHCPLDPDHQRWTMRTACGRVAYLDMCTHAGSDRWGHGYRDVADRLRLDQARLLGRLCVTCERTRW